MLKNSFLVASAATLLSCTAETYIEFDDLNLQIKDSYVEEVADNFLQPESSDSLSLSNSFLLGSFIKEPVSNLWHKVTITEDSNGKLLWNNLAGVSWSLEIKEGKLYSGSDCPYGIQELDIIIEEKTVSSLGFLNERYKKTDKF